VVGDPDAGHADRRRQWHQDNAEPGADRANGRGEGEGVRRVGRRKDDAAGRLADPRVTSAVNVDGRSRWTTCWMAPVTALVTTTAAVPAAPALGVDRRAASAPPSNAQTRPRSATLLIHGSALPQLPRLATSERRSHRLSARVMNSCISSRGSPCMRSTMPYPPLPEGA